ncbi:hypothetical protein AIT68_004122 [Salmonella enterica subsp. salamae]|uniref:hypothetical protein n=1 Tax=Salmonella enterica TaxID=28901 RepID=UPI0009E69452|nr:hypothetical protein [Salmonella enterica]EBQ5244893.1 hypothetical protein [Salmonella enterica subsp. salamae]
MGLLNFISKLFHSKNNKTNVAVPVQDLTTEISADAIKPIEEKPCKAPQPRARTKDYSRMEASMPIKGMFSVRDLEFAGSFSRSSSGKWIIAWQDRDVKNKVGGCRTSGRGRYILYNDREKKITVYGKKLERPDAGKVLNDGTFILTDIRFGNELRNSIYVFNAQGDTLFKRTFGASISNSHLSSGGKILTLTFWGGSGTEANKVYTIDVETKKIMSRKPAPHCSKK